MGQGQKLKIDQIIDWINQSDYYQILNLPRDAGTKQIKDAYFALSRQYHPDKYYSTVEKPIQEKFTLVFKRINEAYMVLKTSRKRSRYDEKVFGPERAQHLRYKPSDEDRGGIANPEDRAKTANGKKYLKLTLAAKAKKDWRAAEMNINFAVNYEPDNDFMRKLQKDLKEEIKNLPKEDPFKIR